MRNGLALALEHDLTAVAAELYQRLSVTLYDSADYRRAEEALDTALQLCAASPDANTEVACVTCMAYVLRERGEWPRAAQMCRDLIASGTAVFVAEGLLGAIHAFEGKYSSARRMLVSSLAISSRLNHYNMTVDATCALARIAAAEGNTADATERCRSVLERFKDSEDHHYAIGGLRWSAAFFAAQGDRGGAHACAEALTRIASTTGHADALAALAHAIAETALLEGDADTAADQLSRAVELHRELDLPFERAQIELRAGVALAAAGERSRRSNGCATPTAPPASSAPGPSPPTRRGRWARWESRSSSGLAGARPRTRTRAGSRGASGRWSASSRWVARTARSPRTCSSARARSTCTSAISCASSTAAHASRPRAGRASSASSGDASCERGRRP